MIEPLVRRGWPESNLQLPLTAAPTATMEEWCRAKGTELHVLFPARDVDLRASTPYSRAFAYRTEPSTYVLLEGARWCPGWDFVIAEDGTVLGDSGYMDVTAKLAARPHFCAHGGVAYYEPPQTVDIPEAIFISAPTSVNVGHWFIDFLPRTLARRFAPDVPLVVPSGLAERQLETLSACGVPDRLILPCDSGTKITFGKLHVYRPGRSLPPNPEHVRFVRGAISRHAAAPTPRKRVFLNRISVGTRLIENRLEFESFLESENFISVDPADLSLAEQQSLFGDCETLLGVFGSNMLALYLAPAGANVIVLTHDPGQDPCLAPTAAILGMRHQDFLCETASDPGLRRHQKDTNIRVDCARLGDRIP